MVTNQAYLFLIFIVNGLIIGFLFDFFRILRRSFKTIDFVTYIEDISFWILTGFIILYSVFVFNNGEIRFFIFLGIALGVLLYMTIFSSSIIKSSVFVINNFKKVFGKILKVLRIPFGFVNKLIKKVVNKLFKILKEIYISKKQFKMTKYLK